ncbi:MAG: hypothetical protein IJZ93_02060 [Clostridia bacterium]|nr:hypothetical protein [Clostridia bacterium]
MEKIKVFSSFVLPCIIFLIGVIFLFGKKDYFSSFIKGARDGISSSLSLLPTMCALTVSISIFSASGISDFLVKILDPVCDFLKIPAAIFPFVLTKPLSGGASMATYENLLENYGADSFIALCASVIMASSDTVFYVLSVYFSESKIKKTRYALPCALFVFLFCVILSSILCNLFF